MSVKCAECRCAPQECTNIINSQHCQNCTKVNCCCLIIHHSFTKAMNNSVIEDNCRSHEACEKNNNKDNAAPGRTRVKNKGSAYEFFRHVKSLYAAALGIEILCVTAAEIGENTCLYILGFNHIGVPFGYVMGYLQLLLPL